MMIMIEEEKTRKEEEFEDSDFKPSDHKPTKHNFGTLEENIPNKEMLKVLKS